MFKLKYSIIACDILCPKDYKSDELLKECPINSFNQDSHFQCVLHMNLRQPQAMRLSFDSVTCAWTRREALQGKVIKNSLYHGQVNWPFNIKLIEFLM